MTIALQESGRTVHQAGRATTALVALSIVLMAALALAFAYLTYRQNALQDGIREDALWAVYQLDREARAFDIAIERAPPDETLGASDEEALRLRYDILYSRLTILDNAKYAPLLVDSTAFRQRRDAVRNSILRLAPLFDELAETHRLPMSWRHFIHATMAGLLPVTERLLTETNASVSAARADARAEIMGLQRIAAGVVVLLGLAIGLLVYSLMRQLRLTREASAQIKSVALELSKAYNAAEAGNRAKSEFMAVMGHEIRTPLNAILGMAELLGEADLPADSRESVRVINRSGQALLEIINEILDFARIEHGEMTIESVDFDVRQLAADAVKVMAGRAGEQGIGLTLSVDGGMASTAFISDPTRITRVLLNLVSNAVKFTNDGAVGVAVSEPQPGRLRFEVSDTGIGIPAEAIPRLFQAFTQVDGTISRRYGGTGLGLAICKRIVDALGGDIGVRSTPGKGSCFWFEIPVMRAVSLITPTAPDDDQAKLPRLNILVVEDNAVNRDVARRFLERLGQQVTLAEDGGAGVRLATSERFDLVLMDMQMPVMDGIAATREIRAIEAPDRRNRIVAMTANASDNDRAECLSAGMDGFLSKPVSRLRLAELIRDEAALMQPATAPVGAPSPSVDEARRGELAETFGDDGLLALDDSFFAEAVTILRDLRAALASGDHAATDRALHTIKGSASNLGYAELARCAEAARAAPQDGDVAAALDHRLDEIRGRAAQAA